jgi:GntR family histidine utilization transcriptional repressor
VPSEQELVAQFGVSRMTVNRALRELSEQGGSCAWPGWAVRGRGKAAVDAAAIANLASEIRQRGHDYRCEVLMVERVSASPEVAAALDLRTGESVFHRFACTSKTACRCNSKTAT